MVMGGTYSAPAGPNPTTTTQNNFVVWCFSREISCMDLEQHHRASQFRREAHLPQPREAGWEFLATDDRRLTTRISCRAHTRTNSMSPKMLSWSCVHLRLTRSSVCRFPSKSGRRSRTDLSCILFDRFAQLFELPVSLRSAALIRGQVFTRDRREFEAPELRLWI